MSNHQEEVYTRWENTWTLVNKSPSLPTTDRFLHVLQVAVVVGSILLSGTRTGNVVAGIGSLADFGQKIGYAGMTREVFVAVEAFLAFITFDAGILLAGYLTGERNEDHRWYYALLVAALVPALAANLLPGVSHLGLTDIGQTAVDVIVGVFTPIMAFVSGRVLGVVAVERREREIALDQAWKEKKRRAWMRSSEYKGLRRQTEVDVSETNLEDRLLAVISENGGVQLRELANQLDMPQTTVMGLVRRLVDDGKVVSEGSTVKLPDF